MPISPTKIAFSIPEAAAAIGVSRATVYREVKAGKIRLAKIRGRSVIPADDLRRLVEGAQ
jgi:excisionase family DNA binding protein